VQEIHIHLLGGGEWSTRLQLYEADQLDLLSRYGLPTAEWDAARERHAGDYVRTPGTAVFFITFDTTRPPFQDVRVRKAFVLATDREHLANVVLRGYDLPATGGFIPAGMMAHSPGIGLPYHPEQARKLLSEAGYPDGRGFPPIVLMGWEARKAWGDSVAQQVSSNLGVDIALDFVPWAAHLPRIETKELSRMFLSGWEASYPDPDGVLGTAGLPERSGWSNEAYERLLKEARRTMDRTQRVALYQHAERILMDESPIMPLTYPLYHGLAKPWLRGVLPAWDQGRWRDLVIEPH
jgi:oligopeptide transport system substrate-binding protein